ncbi:MAG: excinuclease ABC subunit C, partial [Campylobacter sp.]|nr:excinuclease ABC subunit C [Campylobacter sp.]
MKLSPNDAKLQFLQRLRDEAHRFAISFHRKTRDKTNLAKSELAKLGLSAGAIKKLLDYYGGFEAIKAASNDEIARIAGKQAAKKLA